jgi:hypothetical protein
MGDSPNTAEEHPNEKRHGESLGTTTTVQPEMPKWESMLRDIATIETMLASWPDLLVVVRVWVR